MVCCINPFQKKMPLLIDLFCGLMGYLDFTNAYDAGARNVLPLIGLSNPNTFDLILHRSICK